MIQTSIPIHVPRIARAIVSLLMTLASLLSAGCAHKLARAGSQESRNSAEQGASETDNRVYRAALEAIARAYPQERNLYRVQNITMIPCDLAAGEVLGLDCSEKRDIDMMSRPWAGGSQTSTGPISDTTSAELAASFAASHATPQRLGNIDTSRFVLRSRAEIAAEVQAWTDFPHVASIAVSRAGYSSDGHAYLHAVYSRTGMGRGFFATGLMLLLKRNGESWEVIRMHGVWVT